MTHQELFDRYVADTLDDEGTGELADLLASNPEFAAQFAQDLLETGLFVQVGSELQRVSEGEKKKQGKEDEEKSKEKDEDEEAEPSPPGKPGPLKLITGNTEDLPPSLQRLLPGYEPEPPAAKSPLAPSRGAPKPHASPRAAAPPLLARPLPPPPVAEPPVAEPPVAEPPVAEPPVAEPPGVEPPVAEPPGAEPPGAEPPGAEPPGAEPPGAEPPVAEPPVAEPPVAEPPVVEPPAAESLAAEPPAAEPSAAESPVVEPPAVESGPEPPVAESESKPPVGEPPVAGHPAADPPVVEQPVHPLASLLPPPAPPPPAARVPMAQLVGPQALFGHREQPRLRSAQQRSPVVWISIAAVLLVAIGVALFLGLTKKPPPPPEFEGLIGKVDAVDGAVTLTRELTTEKVTAGLDLFEGDVITVQSGSARLAYLSEKTYVHLRSASEIRFEDHKPGKSIHLSLGEVTVEAAPQPVGRPMVIQTDNCRTTLLGTRVTIRTVAKETLVEVSEGSVRVERRKDGEKVEVGRGAWTLVGEEQPLQAWGFVAAVNLNGPATTVDGNPWFSYEEAKAKGMQVEAIGKTVEGHSSGLQPAGYVPHAELRSVLMSSVVARGAKLSIKWPQPNGRYQVFVWMMEDEGSGVRSLRLNVEEKLVGEDLGKEQLNRQWNRYGPFPAEVKDGALDLLVSADHKLANRDARLSAIAIYSAAAVTPSAPAPAPSAGPGSGPEIPGTPADPGTPPGIQPTIP